MAFSLLSTARCVGKPARTRALRLPPISIFDVVSPEVLRHFSTRTRKSRSRHNAPDDVSPTEIITTGRFEQDDISSPEEATLTKKNYNLPHSQYPTTSPLARKILEENWGHSSFRLEQEAVISRLLDGGSAVAVFPTGSGKSLLYQVSALGFDQRDRELGKPVNPGITLVISPLIALIKDQTQELQARGIPAAAIDSSQPYKSILKVYDQIKNNELKLLYCSPERLRNESFIRIIQQTTIRMIAVDEAHCVLEWGHSFRPEYLKVARFAKEIKAERLLCVTATATQNVALNVCSAFGVPTDGLFRSSSYRPNLQLLAKFFPKPPDRLDYLKGFLEKNPGASIVYVTTRAQSEYVAQELAIAGIKALAYHAGMDSFSRGYTQDHFMGQENITIVATIAFGLGINKPNIRNVIHYCPPMSLEGYSQEIGRAGRDGKPSKCMVFISPEDSFIRDALIHSHLIRKNDINKFLKKLFKENKTAKAGDIIERSQFTESKNLDIEIENLETLYTKLELQFGLIRSINPRYNVYTYSGSLASIKSKAARVIEEHSTGDSSLKSIDMDFISDLLNLTRDAITQKLYDWDARGVINLQCAGTMSRYRILQSFPQTQINTISKTTSHQIESYHKLQLERSNKFIELVTGKTCYALQLAEHFGDIGAVPKTGCNNCQYCLTKKPVDVTLAQKKKKLSTWGRDRERADAVLKACQDKSDPELLAKIAYGVRSPKITKLGFGPRSKVFRSMIDCDFEALVKLFTKLCKD